MSFFETLVILLVAVIVFGPKRLPEVARKLGRWAGMLRRAREELMHQIMTMDQKAGDALNSAGSALERLLPEDETLKQALDRPEALLDLPPPTASPDDFYGTAPVPGGLPAETPPRPAAENAPAAPAEPPSAQPEAPRPAAGNAPAREAETP